MNGLRNFEFHFLEAGLGDTLLHIQDFDADNLIFVVEIENHPRFHLLGLDNFRIVEAEPGGKGQRITPAG